MVASILDIDHPTKLQDFWNLLGQEVIASTRTMVLHIIEDKVAGVVTLLMPASETGPFRSYVEKLMVSPDHRRKGIARILILKLEEIAREKERWLLVSHKDFWISFCWVLTDWQMLDTEIGSPAEHVYPRLGYTKVGIVPRYGISPKDGRLVDELFFYKDLRDE